MKELFKKTATSIILSSIAAFIIGLIMVVAPGLSLQTIGIIIGIYIVVYGIILITLAFTTHNLYIPFFSIMSGIFSIILGVILMAMPEVLSTIFTIALGVWIILSSVNIISIAITIRKGFSNWFLLLLFGVLDLIAGIIILFNPFVASLSIVILGGIIIMAHSIISIIDMIIIKKNIKEISKAVESNIKGIKS